MRRVYVYETAGASSLLPNLDFARSLLLRCLLPGFTYLVSSPPQASTPRRQVSSKRANLNQLRKAFKGSAASTNDRARERAGAVTTILTFTTFAPPPKPISQTSVAAAAPRMTVSLSLHLETAPSKPISDSSLATNERKKTHQR